MEADEYAGNFDPYRPDVIVLTSAEWDHPDVFPDGDAVISAFEAWIRRASEGRGEDDLPVVLVANTGDAGVAALVHRLDDWPGLVVRTALDPEPLAVELAGHIVAAEPDGTLLRVALAGEFEHEVRLTTAGRHNAANALGVIGACLAAGYPPEAVLAAVASFTGVGRRLERKGEVRGVVVYDDYGHHPTAIRETLAAVRQREPGRRVWAVYEPLTYHRTAALLDAFADVLAAADAVAIADIWAGRDPDTTIASAAGLAAAVAAAGAGQDVGSPGIGRGDGRLARRGRPQRRRGARDGRRPLLPHRRAAAGAPGGAMTISYAQGFDLLKALVAARTGLRRRQLHRPVRRDGGGQPRSVRAAAGGPQRPPGILARGGRRPSATTISRSSGTGSRGTRSSPRGMQAGTGAPTRRRCGRPGSSPPRWGRTGASCACGTGQSPASTSSGRKEA